VTVFVCCCHHGVTRRHPTIGIGMRVLPVGDAMTR
jgi:hypothetical protein